MSSRLPQFWSPYIDHYEDNDLSGGESLTEGDQSDEEDHAGEQISEQFRQAKIKTAN